MRTMTIKVNHDEPATENQAIRFSGLKARVWHTTEAGEKELLSVTPVSRDGEITVETDEQEVEVELMDAQGRTASDSTQLKLNNPERPPSVDLNQLGNRFISRRTPQINKLVRHGLFFTSHNNQRFEKAILQIGLVSDEVQKDLKKALNTLDDNNGWIAVEPEDIPLATGVAFHRTQVGFDGRFSFNIPVPEGATGWVYILTGPVNAIGFFHEGEMIEVSKRKDVSIFLPLQEKKEPETPAKDNDCKPCNDKKTVPPVDASEEEILAHADMFSDDPGPFCKPFSNPERILGERRFQTILRVEQPEIAAARKIELAPDVVTDFDVPMGNITDVASNSRLTGLIRNSVDSSEILRSVRNVMSSGISSLLQKSLFRRNAKGRTAVGNPGLIDWEGDVLPNQAITVSGGHVLEWRVRWRSNGYSLGHVNHTLTLAPRQIKRIMKIDFERREAARREEELLLDDEVNQATDYSRDYLNAVSANLSEWSKGKSSSHSLGTSVGIGAVVSPGVVIGGGASHGSAWTNAESSGNRDVSATEKQNLKDAIRQHAEGIRQLESTIITETEQQESVEGVSEVIANPNYCHALTVVYYDILRHLRVDTELGGVSECLYVPFNIAPFGIKEKKSNRFNIDRIIRHRHAIQASLLDRKLRWVFRYLEDYRNGFDDIPDIKRMEQELVLLRGTLEIELSVASPLKGDEDARALEEDADHTLDDKAKRAKVGKIIGAVMTPFAPLLGIGVAAVSSKLAKNHAEEREQVFQNEIAGRMARRFIDNLELKVGQTRVRADFTLKGNYRNGATHKVYFQVPSKVLEEQNLSRDDFTDVKITAGEHPLPNYSIANIKSGRISFATSTYRKNASDYGLYDDLLEINTAGEAKADPAEVFLHFAPSSWEKENLRQSIIQDIEKLVQHLDSHLFHYHKHIWWRMDRDELFTILDGYTVSSADSRSLASLVEYGPMAIVGNSLVFKVAKGAFVGVNGFEDIEQVRAFYETQEPNADPIRVSLPSGGVYAQALMDECNACEEHYGSTDWVLEQDQIVPQELDPSLLSSRRAEPEGLTPTNMPDTLINLQNAPSAPAPSGTDGVLGAVTKGDSFRDLAQVAGTQANARSAMEAAKSLATHFGSLAAKDMDAERAARERVANSDLPEDEKQKITNKHDKPEPSSPAEEAKDISENDDDVTEVAVESEDPSGKKSKTTIKRQPSSPASIPALNGDLNITLGLPEDYTHMRLNLIDVVEKSTANISDDLREMYDALRQLIQELGNSEEAKAGAVALVMKKAKKVIPAGRVLVIIDILTSEHTFNFFESMFSAIYDTIYSLLFVNLGFEDNRGRPVLSRQIVSIDKDEDGTWNIDDVESQYNALTYNILGTETRTEKTWGIKGLESPIRILTLDPIDNDGKENQRPELSINKKSSSELTLQSEGDIRFRGTLIGVRDHYKEKIDQVIGQHLHSWSDMIENYLKSLKNDQASMRLLKDYLLEGFDDSTPEFVQSAVEAIDNYLGDDDDDGSVFSSLIEPVIDQAIEMFVEQVDIIGTDLRELMEAIADGIAGPGVLTEALEMRARYSAKIDIIHGASGGEDWEVALSGECVKFPELKITFNSGEDNITSIHKTPVDDQGLVNLIDAEPDVMTLPKLRKSLK